MEICLLYQSCIRSSCKILKRWPIWMQICWIYVFQVLAITYIRFEFTSDRTIPITKKKINAILKLLCVVSSRLRAVELWKITRTLLERHTEHVLHWLPFSPPHNDKNTIIRTHTVSAESIYMRSAHIQNEYEVFLLIERWMRLLMDTFFLYIFMLIAKHSVQIIVESK